jgi:hypothetical protein
VENIVLLVWWQALPQLSQLSDSMTAAIESATLAMGTLHTI